MARLISVGTAVPPNRVSQSEVKEAFRELFASLGDFERLETVYDNAGVESRYLAFPMESYLAATDRTARCRAFRDCAIKLSCEAAANALEAAHLTPGDIGHILLACTTLLATPSLDAYVINRMGFGAETGRTPIFGLGCSGGVSGAALAANQVSERSPFVLQIAVELCSQALQLEDVSKRNLVGTALFGDGAGAAVFGPDTAAGSGPAVIAQQTTLFPDSYDLMGWEFGGEGMRLVLSPKIPDLVLEKGGGVIALFLERNGLSVAQIGRWIVHPGGPKVLRAYQEALDLSDDALAPSYSFLREHGNISSASVFFILEALWREEAPPEGTYGLMASLGPGFSCDLVLLRW